MGNKKTWIKLSLFLICVVVLLHSVTYVMFINSKITCAQITGEVAQTRGGYSVSYVFEVNGKKIDGNMPYSSLKEISLDSLMKFDCIKIEFSKFNFSFNRIVDSRIVK